MRLGLLVFINSELYIGLAKFYIGWILKAAEEMGYLYTETIFVYGTYISKFEKAD